MIARIKSLFAARGEKDAAATTTRQLEFAAAALMVEAASIDGRLDEAERDTIERLLVERFDLAQDEASELLQGALEAHDGHNHLLRFTRQIKDGFSLEERSAVIEMLWEVAYADGELHQYEANLLRRVGGLIYVSDRERGAARKRVLTRLGLQDAP